MFISEITVAKRAFQRVVRHASEIPGYRSAGVRLGYTRVSTVAQTLEQQNGALEAAGVTKTFSDVMSGARDDRSGLAALMDCVARATRWSCGSVTGSGAIQFPSWRRSKR